ncbi:hypothetical protein J6590_047601 [Homalodisca vitripennis]|nr:hypothetical protein J6590_047601 [Homalodisca vitripennis]
MRSASKEWLCNVCRNSTSQAGSVNSAATTTSLTKEFLINVMEQFKKDMFDEMRNFNKEISEVKASLEFLSNDVDTSNTTMKFIQSEMSIMMKENSELKKKCNKLQSDVDGLKEKIRIFEQYSRRTNIELAAMGVRGVALDWFRNYLSGRYQCVKVGDSLSSPLPIAIGVPQGAVLSANLFLVLY